MVRSLAVSTSDGYNIINLILLLGVYHFNMRVVRSRRVEAHKSPAFTEISDRPLCVNHIDVTFVLARIVHLTPLHRKYFVHPV